MIASATRAPWRILSSSWRTCVSSQEGERGLIPSTVRRRISSDIANARPTRRSGLIARYTAS